MNGGHRPLRRTHMSVREIAVCSGRSVRTVRRWIAKGDLPSVMIGGSRLVPVTDFEKVFGIGAEIFDDEDEGS